MDAEQQLAEARKAWANRRDAEFQLSRLRRYGGRLTPGMKDDQQRHCRSLSEADATLARVLGGRA